MSNQTSKTHRPETVILSLAVAIGLLSVWKVLDKSEARSLRDMAEVETISIETKAEKLRRELSEDVMPVEAMIVSPHRSWLYRRD